MKLQLVATCLFGLEKMLGEEIDALGCKRIETIDGRVTFEGTEVDIARANINLRLAERVLSSLANFPHILLMTFLKVRRRFRGRILYQSMMNFPLRVTR